MCKALNSNSSNGREGYSQSASNLLYTVKSHGDWFYMKAKAFLKIRLKSMLATECFKKKNKKNTSKLKGPCSIIYYHVPTHSGWESSIPFFKHRHYITWPIPFHIILRKRNILTYTTNFHFY
jgi:hypothetical protein